ncbi:MAG: hypothetical protein R2771_08170 [Saprospiraceae bacterium]
MKTKLDQNSNSKLIFDVAYAQYGYPYTDTLGSIVLCGLWYEFYISL